MSGAGVRFNKPAVQAGGECARGKSSTKTGSALERTPKPAAAEKSVGELQHSAAGWSSGCGAIVVRSRGRILLLTGCSCEPAQHTGR